MPKKASKGKWIVILGHPLHIGELLKLTGFVLLSLSVVFGILFYFYLDYATESEGEKALREKHYESVETVNRSDKGLFEYFMDEHLSDTGFEEINSLLVNGRFILDGQVFTLMLFAKRPDYCRFQIRWPDGSASSGYDGGSGWSEGGGLLEDLFSIEPQVMDSRLSRFLGILLAGEWIYSMPEQERERPIEDLLQWESGVEWQDRDCNVLTNRGLGDPAIRHYFDSETGFEVSREIRLPAGDSGGRHVLLHFSGPKEDGGYPLPSGFELWLDGDKLGEAEFSRYEANVGLMSYLFERPIEPAAE